MNLHLGNGTVYLDGWINIDLVGALSNDPKNADKLKRNKTTIDKYYKFSFRKNKGNNVTDARMDVSNLQFKDDSADRILAVNLIDHLKKEDFIDTLQEWKRVLKPWGELIIDVDDRRKQAEVLTKAKTIEEIEWALRLIYCDHASVGRSHFWGYTPDYLKHILSSVGFKHQWTRTDYIVHDMSENFQICVHK